MQIHSCLFTQIRSVVEPAIFLQSETDNVFAFGIGNGIDETELKDIATDKRKDHGWQVMTNFDQYESFIRNFISRHDGCMTPNIQPYRKDINLLRTSYVVT